MPETASAPRIRPAPRLRQTRLPETDLAPRTSPHTEAVQNLALELDSVPIYEAGSDSIIVRNGDDIHCGKDGVLWDVIVAEFFVEVSCILKKTSLMAPSDLHIVKQDSGFILSWNSNLTKEMDTRFVKYVLNYKLFDPTKEMTERLPKKEKMIRLGLHSGLHAKVKTQLLSKETEDIIEESNWTEFTYKAPPVYIQNLSCIIYNISNLNCTWDIKTEAPADAQYFLSYRQSRKEFECQLYLTNAKNQNIGCHMKEVYFNPSKQIRFNITVKELSNNSEKHSYYKKFKPQRLEKLNPPINVSIALENRSIKINWKPPPTIGSAFKICFAYQVKITDLEYLVETVKEYIS
ncbi:interleukin-5 receptor subunit alpha-like [Emydura macquarii macquarii]|uniref:interleukin-5 receptor subunit alpha-like n=1 Tax=Emydura macquarii macquarii TaxID=1129001 RepID=UPI00352AD05D